MNTSEIIDNCRKLDGVTVRVQNGYTDLLLLKGNEQGRMRFYPIFKGISLAVISVDAFSWPAPVNAPAEADSKGPLIINYCIHGRCEMVLNDDRHVFLAAGQLSLTEKFAVTEYVYPSKAYEVIEIFIDPQAAASGIDALEEVLGRNVSELVEKYCPKGKTYIAKAMFPDELIDRLAGFAELKTERNHIEKKTAVMDFLAWLLEESGLSVVDVAAAVGYSSQSEFAAAFKKEHKMSPLEYRRSAHLNQSDEKNN